MVPPAASWTAQVTAVSGFPVTAAAKVWDPPVVTLAISGLTVIRTGAVLVPPPPQAWREKFINKKRTDKVEGRTESFETGPIIGLPTSKCSHHGGEE